MAKTGFWLRGAKGKLAGTTLYRGRTGTVQREIVTPTNPKTGSMMLQRAIFAAVAKFYSHGQKAFFKFAFEGKKANQTDFNAFMAENVRRGCYFPADVVKANGYPMVGLEYVLTSGSLPAIHTYEVGDNGDGYFGLLSSVKAVNTTPPSTTVAKVSQDLVAAGYQEGDIITLLGIVSNARSSASSPDTGYMYLAGEDVPPTWMVKQFIVNTADTRNMLELGIVINTVEAVLDEGDVTLINFAFPVQFSDERMIAAGAIVVSRETADGLKVSTTRLSQNAPAYAVVNNASKASPFVKDSYLEFVATSWGAKGDAILKGALATRARAVAPTPLAESVQGATELMNETITCAKTSVGEAISQSIAPGDNAWIRINGENLTGIAKSDVSLSVPAAQGEILDVIATGNYLLIKVAAKASASNVNVRCDKLGGTVCKVSFQ